MALEVQELKEQSERASRRTQAAIERRRVARITQAVSLEGRIGIDLYTGRVGDKQPFLPERRWPPISDHRAQRIQSRHHIDQGNDGGEASLRRPGATFGPEGSLA